MIDAALIETLFKTGAGNLGRKLYLDLAPPRAPLGIFEGRPTSGLGPSLSGIEAQALAF